MKFKFEIGSYEDYDLKALAIVLPVSGVLEVSGPYKIYDTGSNLFGSFFLGIL